MTRTLLLVLILWNGLIAEAYEGKLTIAANIVMPIPPYSWIDTCKEQPVGSTYDMLNRAFENAGQKYSYVLTSEFPNLSFKSVRKLLISSKVEAAILPMIIADDTELIYVSTPILHLTNVIISKKSLSIKAETFSELKNYRGLIPGTIETSNLVKEAELHELNYISSSSTNVQDSLNLLMAGEIDYFISEKFYLLAKFPDIFKGGDLFVKQLPFDSRKAFFALRKTPKNTVLAKNLSKILENLQSSGHYDYLLKSNLRLWINRDRECIYETTVEPN